MTLPSAKRLQKRLTPKGGSLTRPYSGECKSDKEQFTEFRMSLRASAHTGVAIRSPFHVPTTHPLPKGVRIATSLRSSQ